MKTRLFKIQIAIAAKWLLVVALAFGFMGCASDDEKIPFNDEATIPHLETNSIASPPDKSGLPEADERKIEFAVFSELLSQHFWDDGGFTGIFLRADDDLTAQLQKKFSQRNPPIKETQHIDLQPNVAPRDRDTGKMALILSVDIGEPEPDGAVTAIGKWFAGDTLAGFYSFQLKKMGDDWQIQNAP